MATVGIVPSRYLLQIVDRRDGSVIQLEPGLSVEQHFVETCVARICDRGVGVGRTTTHVAEDVRAGIEAAIRELKTQIRQA